MGQSAASALCVAAKLVYNFRHIYIVVLLPMGRAKSWHWEHFHKGDEKANGMHWKTFCKYCVKHECDHLELVEQSVLDAGNVSQACSKNVIMAEGAFHFYYGIPVV